MDHDPGFFSARMLGGILGSVQSTAVMFLDPGRLVDEELELVAPDARWIDELLAACHHPLSRQMEPEVASITRSEVEKIVARAPSGHDMGDPSRHRAAGYVFWMRLRPQFAPPVPFAGHLNLRIENTPDVVRYFGHVGYTVYPPARGRHLSERAVRLLLPLARRHGLNPFWVTTDPDNLPSRRICERLGGLLVETVAIPQDHLLYQRGQRFKCRYRIDL